MSNGTHFARVLSAQPALPKGHAVSVEADITRGLHAFSIVGLPDKAVEEARDRVASAIKNSGLTSPKSKNKKIVISLAPAELKKEGSSFDLPVALAYLLASGDVTFDPKKKLFAGELALDGSVRAIRGALSIALAAREAQTVDVFVPAENAREASLVSGISVIPVRNLTELLAHLSGRSRIKPHVRTPMMRSATHDEVALDDIRGQESAKRALEIAAAGAHNLALYGPPGTGKTMLARAAAGLLPNLDEEGIIEVTAIHSLAGALAEEDVRVRPPLRSPHHTSSYASLIGGGSVPKPGEVTLAHRGILFLDEFPEFHRDVIQALREPLEERVVSVSRARGSAQFPASFMLIAALNPCPCGKLGSRACSCMPHVVEKYRRKISGPVADRIDMWTEVGALPPESFSARSIGRGGEAAAARERIRAARETQAHRLRPHGLSVNADMRARHIEQLARLSETAERALIEAARKLGLSGRGFHRTIKVARTVADLSGAESIELPHMLEALRYRQKIT